MPVMEFSFSPTKLVQLISLSYKTMKLNKIQNLVSQSPVCIRFFRILKTDFRSPLILLKRILSVEDDHDNVYFHLWGKNVSNWAESRFLKEIVR